MKFLLNGKIVDSWYTKHSIKLASSVAAKIELKMSASNLGPKVLLQSTYKSMFLYQLSLICLSKYTIIPTYVPLRDSDPLSDYPDQVLVPHWEGAHLLLFAYVRVI